MTGQRPYGGFRPVALEAHGRRLPLPHLASSEDRYVRFAYATPGRETPKISEKSQKNSHMAYTKYPMWQTAKCPPPANLYL